MNILLYILIGGLALLVSFALFIFVGERWHRITGFWRRTAPPTSRRTSDDWYDKLS